MGIVAWSRDIFKPRYIRPILGEHRTTEGIDLTLPEHRPEPGALETELQASDAGEE